MSYMQNVLAALIAAIKENRITVDIAEAAVRMLDGVPDYCHMDAIKALLKAPSSDEEQPEDYLAVKTFTSSEFHIGDEIADDENGCKFVVIAIFKDSIIALDAAGLVGSLNNPPHVKRTGRNFPAIPAILEELKKA